MKYTDKDIKFLQKNYLKMTDEQLAKKLGREPYAITLKLRGLELYRPEIQPTCRKERNANYSKFWTGNAKCSNKTIWDLGKVA